MRLRIPIITCFVVLVFATIGLAAQPVRHELRATIDPTTHSLQVRDRIFFSDSVEPDEKGGYRFVLHAGLTPRTVSPGWRCEALPGPVASEFLGINASTTMATHRVPLEAFRLVASETGAEPVEIAYGGVIRHELTTQGEEYQRSFSETPGTIEEQGVFLAGTTFWVPSFGDQMVTFELEVTDLDPPWDVVSQGRRIRHDEVDGSRTTTWRLDDPTEEIYLVAGPWFEYSATAGEVGVLVFLREDDPALANKYIEATIRYLDLYESMLPAYPYASFALVENFWETGYGMPGFTLLGSQVIRFPWILTSSYPHELLHNWWGNSVYVDVDSGNWCEGLTAYMADHLFAEQRGEGVTYRRATLKKYSDFVGESDDFPLTEFGFRSSAASEAVGYGKSLMLFHMLRSAVGNRAFLEALSEFDRRHRFTRASFADLAVTFADVTGGDWTPFVEEWTKRVGAPHLELAEVKVDRGGEGEAPWKLSVRLRQRQDGDPFPVTVPVAVTMEDREESMIIEVGSCGRDCSIDIPCPSRPLRIDVDPEFDVMRRLDPLEVPPALSTIFGADAPLFVLPAAASDEENGAWRALAGAWAMPGEPRVILDSEIDALPGDDAWVLGRDNRFAGAIASRLESLGVAIDDSRIELGGTGVDRPEHSFVLVARAASDPTRAVGWVSADPVAAIPGLARKLPHYTRYSYLVFRGDEPENVAKGMWQPQASPMVRQLADGDLPPLKLPARKPLAELPPAHDARRLAGDVAILADETFEGRGLGTEGLARATDWVERRLEEAGVEPAAAASYRQTWRWTGGDPECDMELTNLIARAPGSDPALAGSPVVVIAHLDHLGRGWPDARTGNRGLIHPGADDNASGVAVLLELARTVASEPPRPRPIVFAVVTGEEAGLLGSRHFFDRLPAGTAPFACVNLDTVGRLRDGKLFVLNADSAREWRFIFMGVGYTTGAPVAVVTEPLDSSDQVACIENGVPGVQLFTGPTPDYHQPSDTVAAIDAEGMVVVTEAAYEAVGYLAERVEPLTVTIAGRHASDGTPPRDQAPRRASLGTMPDFAFDGPGVRVQQVMPGSAAEEAGVVAGDVIVALGEDEVTDLRSYSNALKARAPGDEVEVRILRGGEALTIRAVLRAR